MVEHLYESRVMTREEEMVGCYSRGPLMSKEIISCCSRSSLTLVLIEAKLSLSFDEIVGIVLVESTLTIRLRMCEDVAP